MSDIIQPSFAKGELAPELHGRVDTAAYHVGLATARNMYIHPSGGVSNRPGLRFIAPVKDHTYAPRLIPFSFKTTDTYFLEFGDEYMRVIRNGAHVLETALTGCTAAASFPIVVTKTSHGFSDGDEVYITSFTEMTEVNNKRFVVANKTANTFELTDQVTGADIDGSAYAAETTGGSVARIYTVVSPYGVEDLPYLKYTQSADVMTITRVGFDVRKLTRTGHAAWAFSVPTFTPALGGPTTGTITHGGASGSTTYNYRVTAVAEETYEESLPNGATTATGNATLTSANTNVIPWSAVSGAVQYDVYKEENGLYGWIGTTENTSFTDTGYDPDLSRTPPAARDPFDGTDEEPAAVGYYEQRLLLGGALASPDTWDASQIGNHNNYTFSTPGQTDDAFRVTLNSQEVNEIRHFVPGNDLLIMTSGSEWRVTSGSDAAFSATTLRQKVQSYWGCSHRRPITIGAGTIFVLPNGANVRSIGYSFQDDKYNSADIGLLANHLLKNYTIDDWSYASVPDPTIFAVRSDGTLLTLAYNQEQEVIAWAHSDTSGSFKAVATVGNSEVAGTLHTYVVVQRVVNGSTVHYIEEAVPRVFAEVHDCFFVDSGLSFDNPIAISGVTLASPAVITAEAHGLSNGDVVDIHEIVWDPDVDASFNETQPDQLNQRRYTVANKTADTLQLLDEDGASVDSSAFNAYVSGGALRVPTSTVTGLDHLEGRTVVALADGNVVSGLVVENGSIALDYPASRIHVGLRFIADLETLDINIPGAMTVQAKKAKASSVTLKMYRSRGALVGPDSSKLVEMKQREYEAMGSPTDLLTGEKQIVLKPSWNSQGRIFVRQIYPLPLTILSVIPDMYFGD